MIYENMQEEALTCIKAIRDRHDGARRNPFSEAECGHQYARSMASWAAIVALAGFHYSGVDHSMHFTAVPGKYFWSNGTAWGVCTVGTDAVELQVLKGRLRLERLEVGSRTVRLKDFDLSENGRRTIQL